MAEHATLVALCAAILFATAVAEYRRQARRDAWLLGALGTGALSAASAAWLL